jgi:hypothetical protein
LRPAHKKKPGKKPLQEQQWLPEKKSGSDFSIGPFFWFAFTTGFLRKNPNQNPNRTVPVIPTAFSKSTALGLNSFCCSKHCKRKKSKGRRGSQARDECKRKGTKKKSERSERKGKKRVI